MLAWNGHTLPTSVINGATYGAFFFGLVRGLALVAIAKGVARSICSMSREHPQFALAKLASILLVLREVGLSIQATCQSMREARNTRKRVSMQS